MKSSLGFLAETLVHDGLSREPADDPIPKNLASERVVGFQLGTGWFTCADQSASTSLETLCRANLNLSQTATAADARMQPPTQQHGLIPRGSEVCLDISRGWGARTGDPDTRAKVFSFPNV